MSGDDAFNGQGPFSSSQGRGSAGPGQGFRGYEFYQSQVDPEELFRRIFGDGFSRGGFGNHEWSNDSGDNIFNQQNISQVRCSEIILLHS